MALQKMYTVGIYNFRKPYELIRIIFERGKVEIDIKCVRVGVLIKHYHFLWLNMRSNSLISMFISFKSECVISPIICRKS